MVSLVYTGVIGVLSAAALWLTAPSVNEGQTIADLAPTDGRVLAGWTVLASSLLVPVTTVSTRNGLTAADTVVTGTSRAELLPGIETEEAVLDHPVIRAITAADTVEAISELLTACAPS